jgi:hypothetical protein
LRASTAPSRTKTLMTMFGIYIIDGLASSPQLVQKMQPQSKSPTHGNDRIAEALGPGYQQKHRSFRHFFATQDPLIIPPSKEKCPNFKVDEFFSWLRYIWKEAWVLAEQFSIDEQTTLRNPISVNRNLWLSTIMVTECYATP